MSESLSTVQAIKEYFESGKHGRRVDMNELKTLSSDERKELGALCAKELGKELRLNG